MKIEKETLEEHQVKITAEIDQETLDAFKRRAARKISKDYKIPGFRPGKAPFEVIRRNFGDDAIRKQAIELLVDDIYPKILDESEIKPSGPGRLENVTSKDPPIIEFVIPLIPEVDLCDYRVIRKEYTLDEVTDEDVQNVLTDLLKSFSTAIPVESPAEESDLVSYKISGELTEPEEDEELEVLKEMPFQIVIGDQETNMADWPFENFSKELIGLSEKETKSIKHKFTEDTTVEMFKDKEITFQVSIESVKKMELPELDDDFIKSLGDYKSLEDLEKTIRTNLKDSREKEYDQQYISEIITEIVEGSTIRYSPNTLEEEIENVLGSLEQDLARQDLDLETYIKTKDTDRDSYIEEEIKPIAIKRLKRSLVLEETARAENIELDEDELQTGITAAMEQVFMIPGFQKPKSTKDKRKLTDMVSFDTAHRLLNEQMMKRLKDIASGKLDEAETEDAIEQEETSPEQTPEEPVPGKIEEQVAAKEEKTEADENVSPDTNDVKSSQDIEEEQPSNSEIDE